MENKKKDEKLKTVTSLPRQYKYGDYIFKVRREFPVGGTSILEQTVTMLLDEMEKREKTK